MMFGKPVSRAVRGHFLVEAALVNKLIEEVFTSHHATEESPRIDEPQVSEDDDHESSCVPSTTAMNTGSMKTTIGEATQTPDDEPCTHATFSSTCIMTVIWQYKSHLQKMV